MARFKAVSIQLKLKGLLASIRDTVGIRGRYYQFGQKDDFPNIIIDAVNDSGTARECIEKRKIFLKGEGLRSKALEEAKANPDQTFGELIDDLLLQLAHVPAITLQVKYNRAGKPARFYWLPFQHIRKRYDGNFIYNPALGDPPGYHYTINRTNDVIIPAFGSCANPQAVREMIAKQEKDYGEQVGELLYVYQKGIGVNYEHYPVPKWSAGLHDINADAGLSLHEEAQVSNSFKAGVVIATRKMDHVTKDGNGKTEYDYYQDEIDQFCSPDGSPVLTIEGVNDEGAPQVTPLNIQHQMDATDKATERIAKKVCRLMSVPPLLLGIETAGKLGNNQELVNFMKLFRLSLLQDRKLLYQALRKILPEISPEQYEVIELNLFDFIPDKVIDRMTDEQINEAFDLPEIEQSTASPAEEKVNILEEAEAVQINDSLNNLTGKQRQQIRGIVNDFAKERINEAQAKILLKGGFGLSDQDIEAFLGIEKEEFQLAAMAMLIEQDYIEALPKAVKETALKALKTIEEKKVSIEPHRLDQIKEVASGRVSRKTLLAMALLSRHKELGQVAKKIRTQPWKDINHMTFQGLGGEQGVMWAKNKIDE